jgi:four helix bundle protein
MQDFRNLRVWQKAHAFVLSVYRWTGNFPQHELFGLRSQVRRATVSIPANIAEGCGRGTDPDFRRSVHIAFGSACEVEYFLLLAHDLGYLPSEDHVRLTDEVVEVKRMLSGLLATLAG